MCKELHPELRTFLIDRDLLFKFHLNILFGASSINNYINTRYKLSQPRYDSIRGAFDWENSPEGYAYWNSIDDKWIIYLKFLVSGGFVVVSED